LAVIALLTVLATVEEVLKIYDAKSVQLADLLLLFIYTEVLGMIGIFFVSNRIPITLPIFIAMTAIARLIILQGKEMDMSFLLYEAGAILVLALAVLVVRYKPLKTYIYQTDDEG
jgi:protein PsiE